MKGKAQTSPRNRTVRSRKTSAKDITSASRLTMFAMVLAIGLLVLSLFGWASVKTGWALRATLLIAGYAAMLALFARADTFYWALIPSPLAFVGLAFLPKALSDLAKAVGRTPYPAS